MALLILAVAAPLGAQTDPAQAPGASPAPPQSRPGNATPAADAGQDNATQDLAGHNQEPTANSGDEVKSDVPAPLDMSAGSVDFSRESSRNNYLEFGVNLGATYDSNLLLTAAPTISGLTYTVLPNLSLQVRRRRLDWKLFYAGGLVINQRFSPRTQSSNSAIFDLHYRLSPHVTLTLLDNFSRSSQLVDQLPGNGAPTGVGAIQQPNQAVIVESSVLELQNTGTAQISYQYSISDVVGGGVTSYILRYGTPPAGSAAFLLNTQSYEADGFYNHRLTPRNWAGLTYSFDRLTFSPGAETVNSESLRLLYTFYVQPKMYLSFFAGPEYFSLNTELITTVATPPTVSVTATPFSAQHWSASMGGSFSWQGERTSLDVGASRKISDGGGLVGAVELTGGEVGVHRKVGRSATAGLGVAYGESNTLDQNASNFGKVNSTSASLLWSQRLPGGFTTTLGFTQRYQQEHAISSTGMDRNVNESRGWLTLGYEFGKPLGR